MYTYLLSLFFLTVFDQLIEYQQYVMSYEACFLVFALVSDFFSLFSLTSP